MFNFIRLNFMTKCFNNSVAYLFRFLCYSKTIKKRFKKVGETCQVALLSISIFIAKIKSYNMQLNLTSSSLGGIVFYVYDFGGI